MALPYKERQAITYAIPNESQVRYLNAKSWIIMCVTLNRAVCQTSFVYLVTCFPLKVSQSIAGIMAADSVSHTLQVQQWDGEVRQESRHAAELQQLDNGLKIPPR